MSATCKAPLKERGSSQMSALPILSVGPVELLLLFEQKQIEINFICTVVVGRILRERNDRRVWRVYRCR